MEIRFFHRVVTSILSLVVNAQNDGFSSISSPLDGKKLNTKSRYLKS